MKLQQCLPRCKQAVRERQTDGKLQINRYVTTVLVEFTAEKYSIKKKKKTIALKKSVTLQKNNLR